MNLATGYLKKDCKMCIDICKVCGDNMIELEYFNIYDAKMLVCQKCGSICIIESFYTLWVTPNNIIKKGGE